MESYLNSFFYNLSLNNNRFLKNYNLKMIMIDIDINYSTPPEYIFAKLLDIKFSNFV